MSRGITPRFTTWCPEPTTPLGRDNPDGAPLEYHVRLLEAYRDALERHGLEPPPGYGERGRGQRGLLRQLVHGRACDRERPRSSRRRGARALAARERRGAEAPRAGRSRALPRAEARHLHGDADHQLHERLRRAVRLLRVLRPAEPGRRLRALARGRLREDRRAARVRRRPRRLQRRLQPASCRSTTTATCSRRCASATATASSSTR